MNERELTGNFVLGNGWQCTIDGCTETGTGPEWVEHLATHGIEVVEAFGYVFPPKEVEP